MDDRVGASEGAFWGVEDETEALQRYRTLVNTVDDGTFQLDAEGQFVAVNDVVLETGGLRARRIGERVSVVVDEENAEQLARKARRRLETGVDGNNTFALAIETTDGDTVPLRVAVQPPRD